MSQTLRQFLLLFVLLPQLAAASLGNGLVLCVGPGNHIQIEIASSLCSSSDLEADDLSEADGFDKNRPTDSQECSSCEDVELLLDLARPDQDSTHALALPPRVSVGVIESYPVQSRICDRVDRSRVAAHLAPLRTIVLRC